jgi:hypothetical protein
LRRRRTPWGWIIFLVFIAVAASVITPVFLHGGPAINASPPPNWTVASDSFMEQGGNDLKKSIEEKDPDIGVDYIFTREYAYGNDIIVIYHYQTTSQTTHSFPETTDPEDINDYIDDHGDSLARGFGRWGATVQDMRAMPMSCGLVGMYVKYNPEEVGMGERLIVRKGDAIYVIDDYRQYVGPPPTPEMQYLADNITFD